MLPFSYTNMLTVPTAAAVLLTREFVNVYGLLLELLVAPSKSRGNAPDDVFANISL